MRISSNRLFVRACVFLLFTFAWTGISTASAKEPVPFITSISPVSIAPANRTVSLTINGANFAASPTVFWASTNVPVTSSSATRINVTLPAALANVPAVGVITVQNPGNPIKSNVIYLPVARPFNNVAFAQTNFRSSGTPLQTVAGDLNGDGLNDLVVSHNFSNSVGVFLGKADGTFQTEASFTVDESPEGIAIGDFNGDGFVDLVVGYDPNGHKTLGLLLGNGDGTFQPFTAINVPHASALNPSVADVNKDGNLDIVVPNTLTGEVYILLGQGNGTFTLAPVVSAPLSGLNIAISDFNEDGILDFALAGIFSPNLYVYRGAGDGTFTLTPPLFGPNNAFFIRAADIDGDGHQDLLVSSHSDDGGTFLGRGDGTFQLRISTPHEPNFSLDVADLNNDGNLDLIGDANTSDFYFGNGDGTFQDIQFASNTIEAVTIAAPFGTGGGGIGLASADFTNQNLNVLTQTVVASIHFLVFDAQAVGTTSAPRVITINNPTPRAAHITDITFVDGDTAFFSQTNNCGAALPANSTCNINVSFTANAPGAHPVTLKFNSDAPGDAPSVDMLGAAFNPPIAVFNPTSLDFGAQNVSVASVRKIIDVQNTATLPLDITSISITGANAGDFAQTNNCPASIPASAHCTITLTFTPSTGGARTASVSLVTPTSQTPLTVGLQGTGKDFAVAFSAPQTVNAGTSATFQFTVTPAAGFNQAITLTCSGAPAQSTCAATPNSVTPDGTHTATIPVTITTTASTAIAPKNILPLANLPRSSAPQRILFIALSLVALLIALSKPKFRQTWASPRALLAYATLLLIAMGTVGCGGYGSTRPPSGGTPAGTYTVTITATSGALSHTATAQLTVR